MEAKFRHRGYMEDPHITSDDVTQQIKNDKRKEICRACWNKTSSLFGVGILEYWAAPYWCYHTVRYDTL